MIKSLTHVGISVKNLDRAVWFCCEALGFEAMLRFRRPQDYTRTVTGVEGTGLEGALIKRDGLVVELLEYTDRVDRAEVPPSVYLPRVAHIAFEVDDIESSIQSLSEKGGSVMSAPVTVPAEPGADNKVVYGYGPGGIVFELVEKNGNRETSA